MPEFQCTPRHRCRLSQCTALASSCSRCPGPGRTCTAACPPPSSKPFGTKALTTLGLIILSSSFPIFSLFDHILSHLDSFACLAVGLSMGSMTSKLSMNSLASMLTACHASTGANMKSPRSMLSRTCIRVSGPPHPPKGGSPLNSR